MLIQHCSHAQKNNNSEFRHNSFSRLSFIGFKPVINFLFIVVKSAANLDKEDCIEPPDLCIAISSPSGCWIPAGLIVLCSPKFVGSSVESLLLIGRDSLYGNT